MDEIDMDEEYEALLQRLLHRAVSDVMKEVILDEISQIRSKLSGHQSGNSESAGSYSSDLFLASGF